MFCRHRLVLYCQCVFSCTLPRGLDVSARFGCAGVLQRVVADVGGRVDGVRPARVYVLLVTDHFQFSILFRVCCVV
jgi:hypothetical protein